MSSLSKLNDVLTHGVSLLEEKEWGLRYFVFNKSNQKVMKEKWFASDKDREKFMDKIADDDSFAEFYSSTDPIEQKKSHASESLNQALEQGIAVLENKLHNPRTGRMVGRRYLRKLTNTMKVAKCSAPVETPTHLEPSMVVPMASLGVVSEASSPQYKAARRLFDHYTGVLYDADEILSAVASPNKPIEDIHRKKAAHAHKLLLNFLDDFKEYLNTL